MAAAYLRGPDVRLPSPYQLGCSGKLQLTRGEATRVRLRLSTVHGCYRCTACGAWHVTSFRGGPLPKRALQPT